MKGRAMGLPASATVSPYSQLKDRPRYLHGLRNPNHIQCKIKIQNSGIRYSNIIMMSLEMSLCVSSGTLRKNTMEYAGGKNRPVL
jgi:hypothetical protein